MPSLAWARDSSFAMPSKPSSAQHLSRAMPVSYDGVPYLRDGSLRQRERMSVISSESAWGDASDYDEYYEDEWRRKDAQLAIVPYDSRAPRSSMRSNPFQDDIMRQNLRAAQSNPFI